MKKRLFFSAILICLVVGSLNFAFVHATAPASKNIFQDLRLFSDVLSLVQGNYVEEVKSSDLIYGAIRGMIGTLDPYSQYMRPEDYKEMQIHTKGSFGGLGIVIAVKDNLLTIVSPIEGTPAFRAGLHTDDRIIKIDGEPTKDLTLEQAVNKMRGPKGTKVSISILREGEDELLEFNLIRDIIKIKSIKAKMFPDGIGYIRLMEFKENSGEEMGKAIEKLKAEGMKSLILDLRHNPGGLLNVSVQVVDYFIPKGELVVYTKGRNADQTVEFRSDREPIDKNIPLVVLVNKGSASASEIVAGAIQDHHRGIIVGEKTFGKASVQTIIPLSDDSGLRLTTAHYYTPSGRMIHGVGITPDLVVEISHGTQMNIAQNAQKKENEDVSMEQSKWEEKHDSLTLEEKLESSDEDEISVRKSATWEDVYGVDGKENFDIQLKWGVDVLLAQEVYKSL
ncbi:MAG: S41 family peptidase [bacterium]|nr:S41 family peptidase [bacterium]